MKNLDIENLERKNIYTAPPDFFAKMQENVLQNVTPVVALRQNRFKWQYAVAAVVTLLVGFTAFIFTPDSPTVSSQGTLAVHRSGDSALQTSTEVAVISSENPTDDAYNSAPLASVSPTVLPAVSHEKKNNQKKSIKVQNIGRTTERQIDQVLANFPVAELADLSRHAEPDVYLDLYN